MYSDIYDQVKRICDFVGLNYSENILNYAVKQSTFYKISVDAGTERAGLGSGPGVWREFFADKDIEVFNQKAGHALEKADYAF